MTTKTHAPRVLRLGLVQDGALTWERLIPADKPVTVGTSAHCTLCLEVPGESRAWTLFQAGRRGGLHQLQLAPGSEGKLAQGSQIQSWAQWVEAGATRKRRGRNTLLLHPDMRGKLRLGEATLLFQYVEAPPVSARMLSGGSFRPRLFDPDDPVFLGLLSVWSAAACALMVWVYGQAPPALGTLETFESTFAHITMPAQVQDPDPIEPEAQQLDPETPGPEVLREQPEPQSATGERTDPDPIQETMQERRDRLERDLTERSAILRWFVPGTTGEHHNGQTNGVFDPDDVNLRGVSEALDEVDGHAPVAQAGLTMRQASERGTGREDAGIGGVERGGSGDSRVGQVEARVPESTTWVPEAPEVDDDDLAGAIREVVARNAPQIKNCYEQVIKDDPNLSGRIVLEISVQSGGRPSVRVDQDSIGSPALEACVTRRVRTWRFPSQVETVFYAPFSLTSGG